jgi:hypothetical protein
MLGLLRRFGAESPVEKILNVDLDSTGVYARRREAKIGKAKGTGGASGVDLDVTRKEKLAVL